MATKKETTSNEKYWNAVKELQETMIKMEQINALANALSSMVTYETNNKWEIIVDMIRDLSK